jgi:RimJ/RimL family protein N-acetyltransferase
MITQLHRISRLEGSLCQLEPLSLDQTHDHLRYLGDPDTMEHLWYLGPGPGKWTADAVVERLSQQIEMSKAGDGLTFSIFDIQKRSIVGQCGFKFLDIPNRKAEFGAILDKSVWGVGIASEALLLSLDAAFGELNLNRIEFRTVATNIRAIKFLASVGAISEGIIRQSFAREKEYIDELLYSILVSEWQEKRSLLIYKITNIATKLVQRV